jgi:hypothetical protein
MASRRQVQNPGNKSCLISQATADIVVQAPLVQILICIRTLENKDGRSDITQIPELLAAPSIRRLRFNNKDGHNEINSLVVKQIPCSS